MSTTTLSAPEHAADNVQTVTTPHFLLRVAGLSIRHLEELQFTDSVDWLHEVECLETLIEEKREPLVEALHRAIHEHADVQPLQRNLINLKRDIFNRRAPKDASKALSVVAALPPAAGRLLEDWLAQMAQHGELLKRGQRVFEQELDSKRARLKLVLQDPDFRNGLLLSSPTLERDLDNYLKAPNGKMNRRLRLVERAVLLYLLRTACKTSPFSTFGAVTVGDITDAAPQAGRAVAGQVERMDKRSFVKLNVVVLSRLSFFLLSCPDVLPDLPIRLKDGWEIEGARVRFLRRILHINTTEGPWALDSVEESIFHLPLSPTLAQVIARLKDGRVVKLDELSGELSAADEDPAAQLKVREFLIHLLHLDLLTVRPLQVDLNQPELLRSYWQQLRAFNNPTAAAVAAHLERVDTLLRAYPTAGLAERRQIIAAVEQAVAASYARVGASAADVPRSLVYEDATIAPHQLTLSAADWQERLDALADIQRLLPIFDASINARLVMNAYFKRMYGAGEQCHDIHTFTEAFSQEYYDQYQKYNRSLLRGFPVDAEGVLQPTLNHFKVAEIEELDELRQAVAAEVGRAYTQAAGQGDAEVELAAAPLQAIAARVPQNLTRVLSHAFFSQLAQTEAGPRLVVNKTYGGLTQMFSRFLYPLAEHERDTLTAELRATLERVQPAGALFAELHGGYDSNLNLHPPVTRYEIVCPGDVSARPAAEQITLDDLYIAHDEASDSLRLYSKRLQCEIIPLYLGFLLPISLPQLRRILINFSYSSVSLFSPWRGVPDLPRVGQTIAFYPRVQYKGVTLQRAMWRLAAAYFPARQPNESDADFFRRVAGWRRENNLPQRVFVTPDLDGLAAAKPAAAEADAKGAPAEAETKYDQLILKPMYVDFENYFSVLLLERAATKGAGRLVLTEMLPGHEQLWFAHEGQPYVTEFIIELHRTQGVPHV
jgi:hypothetical protein